MHFLLSPHIVKTQLCLNRLKQNAPYRTRRMKQKNKKDIDEEQDVESEYSESSSDLSSCSDSGESTDILDINPVTFFSVKELCYYRMIKKFFSGCNSNTINQMIDIVEGKSDMSLRVLDWFVTKYSKKRIDCGQSKDVDMFDIRISYKSQLKSYKKKYFDPFRRKKKFNYYFENGQTMKTTLGQLNFFKWAFSNNIVVYVDKNLKQVIKEMKMVNKDIDKKNKPKKDSKKKKKESSEEKKTKTSKTSKTSKIPKKTKKTNDIDNNSGNIKINTTKHINNNNKDGEVQLTLIFD